MSGAGGDEQALRAAVSEVNDFLGGDSEFTAAQVLAAVKKANFDADDAVELLLDADEEVMAAVAEALPAGAEKSEKIGDLAGPEPENGIGGAPRGAAGAPAGGAGGEAAVDFLSILNAAPPAGPAPKHGAGRAGAAAAGPSLTVLQLHGEGGGVVREDRDAVPDSGAWAAAASAGAAVSALAARLSRLYAGCGVVPFDFSTPSPDDEEMAKRQRQTVSGGGKARRAVNRMSKRGRRGGGAAAAGGAAGTSGDGDAPPVLDPNALVIGGSDDEREAEEKRRWEASSGSDSDVSDGALERRLGLPQPVWGAGRAAAASAAARGRAAPRIAVVGSLQSGKSTLIGRLLADLGEVPAAAVYSAQQKSRLAKLPGSAHAWLVDTDDASRRAGQTLRVTTTRLRAAAADIVDTPGLRRLAGDAYAAASTCGACVLVVSALPGEHEKKFRPGGQAREALALAAASGCGRIVLAVNKLHKSGYSEARFAEVCARVSAQLAAAGYGPARVRAVPVSGLSGENVTEARDSRLASWWRGDSLLDALRWAADDGEAPAADAAGPPRLLVLREGVAYVASGTVARGDRLVAYPSGRRVVVEALPGRSDDEAVAAGRECGVRLADPAHMRAARRHELRRKRARERRGTRGPDRGDASGGPDAPPAVFALSGEPHPQPHGGDVLLVRADLLHSAGGPLLKDAALVVRRGPAAGAARCTVRRVVAIVNRSTGERSQPAQRKGKPPGAEPGEAAVLLLEFGGGDEVPAVEAGCDASPLARFLLADPATGRTVAFAWVAPPDAAL